MAIVSVKRHARYGDDSFGETTCITTSPIFGSLLDFCRAMKFTATLVVALVADVTGVPIAASSLQPEGTNERLTLFAVNGTLVDRSGAAAPSHLGHLYTQAYHEQNDTALLQLLQEPHVHVENIWDDFQNARQQRLNVAYVGRVGARSRVRLARRL